MENKEKILVSASELFKKYGVRSVSMDDIARNIGVSKKTIYQYFKDKDEIVLLAAKAYIEYEIKKYKQVEEESENAIEELVGVNCCMRQDFKEINPSLLFDLEKYHPKAWQEWLDFKYKHIREFLSNNLKKGILQGYIRKDVDADLLALMRVEQVQMAFDTDLFSQENYTVHDIQVKFFDHFIQGVLTDKGREMYSNYLKQDVTKI